MNIGDVIAIIRRRKRIGQQELAESISTSVSYLSQVEKNRKKPSFKMLKKIAVKLDIPLSALIFETIEEKHISNESDRNLFNLAKPMMENLIELLSNYQIETDVKKTKEKNEKKEPKSSMKKERAMVVAR